MGDGDVPQGELPVLLRRFRDVAQGVVPDTVAKGGVAVAFQGVGLKGEEALVEPVVSQVAEILRAAGRLFVQGVLGQDVVFVDGAVFQVVFKVCGKRAVLGDVVVDGTDLVLLPQGDIVSHVNLALFHLDVTFYLRAEVADVSEVVLQPLDAFFDAGGVVYDRSGAELLEEPADTGFPISAPVVDRQHGVDAQQVRIGLLDDVGTELGGVEVFPVHLDGIASQQILSVLEGACGTAGCQKGRPHAN